MVRELQIGSGHTIANWYNFETYNIDIIKLKRNILEESIKKLKLTSFEREYIKGKKSMVFGY